MNSGFIAALLVMVIMTAFTLAILKIIAASTGNKIRDNVITQMQTYELLIQNKVTELNAIQKQIEREQEKLLNGNEMHSSQEQALPDLYVPADVEYRNKDFSVDYRNLKEQLLFDREKIVKEIYSSSSDQSNTDSNLTLDGLIEKFTFENVYRLSSLDIEEQLEVINEILSEDERSVLNEFVSQTREFSCITFYQWLFIQKQIINKQLHVRSADPKEDYRDIEVTIRAEYDKNLCEGFQVLIGNKLYDYGIRKYELL